MPIEIRQLCSDEAELFRSIREEAVRLHPEAFVDTPEEVLTYPLDKVQDFVGPSDEFPEKFILGAFEGNQLLGVVGFFREECTKEKHRGYVWSVYVRAGARGRGISRALMTELISRARKIEGLEYLALDVATTQSSARALYDSLGFGVIGLKPCSYKLSDRYIDNEMRQLKL
jgi:ribosomal protein S18 acetylase RimI-like enzyme